MPNIRPISDLRNHANEISEYVKAAREPVILTKNGVGDMVVLSMEQYERQTAQLELYAKLAEAEAEFAAGLEPLDFTTVADELRRELNGDI